MSTVMRKVSERKTAEEFNSVLLEYSPNPIKVCYPDLSIAYINPALEKITGYSREELIGKKPPYPYWGEKDSEQYERDMLQHLYLDANILERRLYRKDGEPFLVETNVSLVKQGETLKFFIFNWMDITARKRAENELTQQNILLTSLVNSPSDILIFALDKYYCYTTFNDLHRQEMLRGWNVDIKIGMNFLSLITIPELHRQTQQSLERVLKGEIIKETHYQPAKNVYYEFIWNPIKQKNGTIVGITCFCRDITELHLAAMKINLLNERLTVATQAASIGVTDLDIKQNAITWDNRMFEIYEIPYEVPLPYEKWAQAVHPEDLPGIEASVNNVIRNKSRDSFEFRIFRPDGSMRYINGVLKAVVDENSEAVRLVGVNIDITEKKLAETALKESEAFNASLLHDSPNPILVNNLEGFVTYANQAVINLTGFSREEIIGTHAPHSWWPIEKWNEYEVKDVKNHRPVTFNQERCYQKKNGENFWVVINMRNVFENGQIKYYISNWVEITERKKAEEALMESEEKYRTMIENIQDVFFRTDWEGNVIMASPSAKNLFGCDSTEQILKLNAARDLYARPDDRALFLKTLKASGTLEDYPLLLKRVDGEPIFVSVNCHIYQDKNGKPLGIEGVFRDVTARKKAEEALLKSEAKYRSLVETASSGVANVDMTGNLTFVNDTLCKLLGDSKKDLIGKPLSEMVFQDDLPSIMKRLADARDGAISGKDMEFRTVFKDGRQVWFYTNPRPITLDGKISGFSVILNDITERKKAEEKLKLAAQEWRTTFDSITDMVYIRDRQGKIIRMNRAFANRLNKQPTELIDSPCCQVVHGRKESPSNCPYQKVLTTKKPSSTEYFEPSLGIYIQESISPILDETGEISGSVNILRDMTEHKRLEEQLMLTDRLATIGELAAGVAHELNNPLTSVIGFSQLILEGEIPPEIKGDLTVINSEAQRAAKIVRNLLTFGRKHKPVKQLNQINECITEVLSLRAYEHKCRNIKVINRLDTGLPKIFFDYFQMQQVFINLIINAEFFMIQAHNGGILTLTSQQSDGLIRISISDDGPGMTEETLKRLFNPFFTTKEIGQGTGLGLAICHGIVSEHGGNIHARSELGKGATFVVELPVKEK